MKNPLQLSSYDYDLPPSLIAQSPAEPRDSARLMAVDLAAGEISHRRFSDLPEVLSANDVLVFNDSKVIPARLLGHKDSGGKAEVFLLRHAEGKNIWQCLIKGRIKPGQKIILAPNVFAQALEKLNGLVWLVKFNVSDKKLFALGEVPLPPYIKNKSEPEDYQTIFAKTSGSVAAPTAGLHFTNALIKKLRQKGVGIEFVTLHVGLGTFLSVEEKDISKHKMHSELAEINPAAARRLNQAKAAGKRIIAVGTTAARTLESCADKRGRLKAQRLDTSIFIYPGYRFKFIDGLITNFHLPKSSLLMLVTALAGPKLINRAYRQAIKLGYRFFSFGDGMLIFRSSNRDLTAGRN